MSGLILAISLYQKLVLAYLLVQKLLLRLLSGATQQVVNPSPSFHSGTCLCQEPGRLQIIKTYYIKRYLSLRALT